MVFRIRTKQRIFIIIIVVLLGCFMFNVPKQIPIVIATNPTSLEPMLSVETIDFPDYAYYLFVPRDGSFMLIATNTTKVYKYDGSIFKLVLDRSAIGNKYRVGIFEDEQGNLYVSFDDEGVIWRSTDRGETWTQVFSSTYFDVAPKPAWASFGNGTIIIGSYSETRPYIYRSDDWGQTWYLWLNFTEIFPKYAQKDPNNPEWFWIRHIHAVLYISSTNKLFVSVGDVIHALYKWSGGDPHDNSSWIQVLPHGPTSYLVLEDRVLWAPDGWYPLMLYNITSDEFKPVVYPINGSFGLTNIFKSFAYDSENGVIYLGTDSDSIPSGHKVYPSIFASTDKGETWTWLMKVDDLSDDKKEADLAVFGNYIYMAYDGVLKRFRRLTKAEISYIHNSDMLSKEIYRRRTHMSLANVVLKNPIVTIENLTVNNIMANPSFETWGTPPPNWTDPYYLPWTGTRVYQDGGPGVHGDHSYQVIINGNGSTEFYNEGPYYLSSGYYLYTGYLKTNDTSYNFFKIFPRYVGASAIPYYKERFDEYFVNNWGLIGLAFYISPEQETLDWRFYFHTDILSDYPVKLNMTVDAFAAYKLILPTEIPEIPYSPTNVTSEAGSIVINGETISWTELSKTASLGDYLCGYIPIVLLSGNVVNITISGEEILKISNGTIERKGNGPVYIGKIYSGFKVIKNTENALIIGYDYPTNVTSASFTDQRLHVVLEGPTGVTGTTVIYCPYDPIMIFEDGELKTTGYTWNPDTKLLTVNVTFSSPVELDVYFAVPRVESHKVEGEFLGYVFPGTQTVKLNLQLYSEGSQVSQDTRIILEVYNMDGALIYTTAKRETLTQETKTVAFNIPDLEPGIYLVKITLQNPDTGETLNTYSFLLKVTYPWWLWLTAIIAAIGIATVIMYKKKRKTFSLKERLQHVA